MCRHESVSQMLSFVDVGSLLNGSFFSECVSETSEWCTWPFISIVLQGRVLNCMATSSRKWRLSATLVKCSSRPVVYKTDKINVPGGRENKAAGIVITCPRSTFCAGATNLPGSSLNLTCTFKKIYKDVDKEFIVIVLKLKEEKHAQKEPKNAKGDRLEHRCLNRGSGARSGSPCHFMRPAKVNHVCELPWYLLKLYQNVKLECVINNIDIF